MNKTLFMLRGEYAFSFFALDDLTDGPGCLAFDSACTRTTAREAREQIVSQEFWDVRMEESMPTPMPEEERGKGLPLCQPQTLQGRVQGGWGSRRRFGMFAKL